MAVRKYFIACSEKGKPYFETREVNFIYYNGFAITQKQKSIISMHDSISHIDDNLKVLEVSSKSTTELGVRMSAFNLRYYDQLDEREYPIENIFQSSKVFEYGGPYRDLLNVSPKQAKRDERLKTSGKLKEFVFHNETWALEPKSMFYDWLYINALYNNKKLSRELIDGGYNTFTDIEFNHKKSVNCQARSAAIFVSLYNRSELENLIHDREFFTLVYEQSDPVVTPLQMSFL